MIRNTAILFFMLCLVGMKPMKPNKITTYTGTMVDTTIDGWNAVVYRPDVYWTGGGNPDSALQSIVFSYGAGEIAASYATLRSIGGPIAYLEGGWDGSVSLANGTHYPIVIGLRIPIAFPSAGQPLAKLDAIRAAFKIKKRNLHVGGFSAGGYAYKIMATEDAYDSTAPYGPFTYADAFKSIVDVMGVVPDDNAQWYDKVKNFAHNNNGGGRYLGFWGSGDGDRQIPRFSDTMNVIVSGSGNVQSNSDAHAYDPMVFRVYGNPNGTAPQVWTIGGVAQTAYQWMLRQGDTTLAGVTRYRVKKRVN